MSQCPLCHKQSPVLFHQDKNRSFQQCIACQLVFVPAGYHLSMDEEKAEYDKHQNSSEDVGYRRFLARTTEPLFERLDSNSVGIDFGCGPAPTISVMAAERGIKVFDYDLYYCDDKSLLETQYDFIVSTEVIEHIANPHNLLILWDSMLKNDGVLAIMTKRVKDKTAFSRWHYKNDPTHICFYSLSTFDWIAQKMNWQAEVIDNDVIFFTKG